MTAPFHDAAGVVVNVIASGGYPGACDRIAANEGRSPVSRRQAAFQADRGQSNRHLG